MTVFDENTISLKDAARMLRKTYGTVYRWLSKPGASGRPLEAKKVGGTWYTSTQALDRYGESRVETQPTQNRTDTEAAKMLARFGIKF